jgi:predicted hydrocarbon binding protein
MKNKQQLKLSLINKPLRKKLGTDIPLTTFRLFRLIGMQEILGDSAGPTLYMVGKSVGRELELTTLEELLMFIQKNKIGIPEVVEKNEVQIYIRLYECMTCAGMPDISTLLCHFECGLIAGAIEKVTGKKTKGNQLKGWSNGDEVCEFQTMLY